MASKFQSVPPLWDTAPQGTGRGRRCHAAGGSAGNRPLAAPPAPRSSRGRAALVTRMGLPQCPRGGLFFLPGWAAGAVPGRVFSFSGGRAPLCPTSGELLRNSSQRPARGLKRWPEETGERSSKRGGASGSACGGNRYTPFPLPV